MPDHRPYRSAAAGRTLLAALVAAAAMLSFAQAALAGEPATVTVRAESFDGVTLLPQTEVTTSSTPVPVEGGTCSGTSAGGALYDAVQGNWKAVKGGLGVEVLGIDGVDLPPFGSENYAYWSFWVNNSFATKGACEEELSPGTHVLFFAQCFATGPLCPTSETAPEHLLTSKPPSAATVGVNEPVSVTIGSLSTSSGAAEPALPTGTGVSDGSRTVTPDAGGTASFTFSSPGVYTLQAHAPNAVPSDPQTVCVHSGDDGRCGTNGPAGGVSGFKEAAPYKGPYALVAHTTTFLDGHRYTRTSAPRSITGTVLAHSGVSSVRAELRRRFGGRCSSFDGARTRFVHARCGSGSFFQISTGGAYSYYLPAALARGRYVLDIQASDVAGNGITPARGTSRIVFYVG